MLAQVWSVILFLYTVCVIYHTFLQLYRQLLLLQAKTTARTFVRIIRVSVNWA